MELSGAGTGSLALSIAAKPDPEAEISPGGQDALVSPPRPLVDRASEALIGVMAQFATRDAVDDTLAATLTLHGSRFTSALRNLADAIARGGFDFQARWEEPYFPTQRVTWTTSTARDARGFIDGRDLDAEETELAGTLVTISNRERWLLDTADPDSDDGVTTVKLSATNITDEVARSLSVGDEVTVHAIVKTRMQPDGRTHSSYQALAVERRSEDRPAAE
ncbi:hypothetical protein [Naumannella halotolerans]|nr:hypothetical protein [Naumannella halotolerans]